MPHPLITKPGFYPDLTPAQYFAEPCPEPALTNSGIKDLLQSCPAKFAYRHPAIGQPPEERKETIATHLGSLVHRLALGKGDDYIVSPYDEYRSKEAKEWKASVEKQGIIPVKAAVYDQAEAMAKVIRKAIQKQCQGHPYETEVVVAWQRLVGDRLIWCRLMLDVWCPALMLAMDVKTIIDASDKSIVRAFATGYAQQEAWYTEGVEAALDAMGKVRFIFLFVEKDAPYLDRVGDPSEAFREGAKIGIDHAASIFAECMTANAWPGYKPIRPNPPVWWLREMTDIELED